MLRQARDSEVRRLAQAEDDLQRANSDLVEKEKQLSRLAKEAGTWQENCAKLESERKKLQVDVQEQTKDWSERDKARAQDHQSQVNRLQSEISEYERRLTDLRQTLRANDQELLQLKQQLLEAHLSATHSLKREKQRREEDVGRQRNAIHTVVQQVQAFRSALNSLRMHVESDLRLQWTDISSTSQTLTYEISEHEVAMQRISAARLQEALDSVEYRFSEKYKDLETELSQQTNTSLSFQEQAAGKDKHLEALRTAAQLLKRENQTVVEELERVRGENGGLRAAQEQLMGKLKENSRAFDDLQHEVQIEASRLKSECDSLRRELAKKADESTALQRAADDVRRRSNEDLRNSQDEIRQFPRKSPPFFPLFPSETKIKPV